MRILLAMLVALVPAAAAPGPNLVKNAGLEEELPPDQLPAGWLSFASPDGQYVQRLGGPGHGSVNAWTVEGKGEFGGVVAARVRVEPNRCYVAGGFAKVVGPGKALIKIDYYHQDQRLESTLIGAVERDADWAEFRIVDWRYIPNRTTHVGLVLVLVGDGVALFDDLVLQSVERPIERLGDNLLSNGHFENGLAGKPAAFTLHRYPREEPRWLWSAEAARTGERGLRLEGDTTYIIFAHDPVPVDRTATYTLRGWVRPRAGEAVLKLDYLDENYKWLGQQLSRVPEANGTWQEVELQADFTDYPAARYVSAAAFALEPGTDADFDDLELTGPRVTLTEPPRTPAQPAPPATPGQPTAPGAGAPTFRPQ